MDWLKNKKKVVYGAVSVISVAALIVVFIPYADDDEILDFSTKGKSSSKYIAGDNLNIQRSVKIPDPSYKETSDFQDFQVIRQMYVHAMAPFKKETERWERDLLSLRMQRERIELTKDAAEVAGNEAKLAEFKAKTIALNNGTYSLNSAPLNEEVSDITNFESSDNRSYTDVYNARDLRLILYATGNKYAHSSVTIMLGSEKFKSVKANQVIASQFRIETFDDDNYCVHIKNLAQTDSALIKICRS
jgi:hypothetical protein